MQKKQINYAHSAFTSRPSEPVRFLVMRNREHIFGQLLGEVNQFKTSSAGRARCIMQLINTVVCCEYESKQHFPAILKCAAKILTTEDQNSALMLKLLQTVGSFLDCEYYVPQVLSLLKSDSKSQARTLAAATRILTRLLKHQNDQSVSTQTKDLVAFIKNYQLSHLEGQEAVVCALELTSTVVNLLGRSIADHFRTLMSMLLSLQSHPELPSSLQGSVAQTLNKLAKKCGFMSVEECFLNELQYFLGEFLASGSYKTWRKTSHERFKFDSLCKTSGLAISRFLGPVIQILKNCMDVSRDIQLRMDMLVLAESLVMREGLHQAILGHGLQLVRDVFVPALRWKVGKPQIKIRKAGIVNLIHMLQKELISVSELPECYVEVLPVLKNCIGDDWAPELRFACCEFVQVSFAYGADVLGDDQIREVYPLLLERLDDPQNPIRAQACAALSAIICCKGLKSNHTIFRYILEATIVHLDDVDEEIRTAVLVTMKHAARYDAQDVLREAEAGHRKARHKLSFGELAEYARDLLSESSN